MASLSGEVKRAATCSSRETGRGQTRRIRAGSGRLPQGLAARTMCTLAAGAHSTPQRGASTRRIGSSAGMPMARATATGVLCTGRMSRSRARVLKRRVGGQRTA
jgi:hypothetical protein